MTQSKSESSSKHITEEKWKEIVENLDASVMAAGPGWLGCLGLCYDIEITFKEAAAKVLSVDPKPPKGTVDIVNALIEKAIQALAGLKFPSKHWVKECADEDCDCIILFGPGESDFKLPTIRKKKTFTIKVPLLGNLAFTVEFELTVTIHAKWEVGVCTEGPI